MKHLTSTEIFKQLEDGNDVTLYDLCLALIRECNDITDLKNMLIETLENAKNAEELSEDILCNFFNI
jgi:hypothetical protein